MGQVLGDVLGLAAAVAVSPLPIIAMILVLATPRGRLNGILFTVGWILGLSVLGAAVLAIVGPRGSSSSSSTSSQPGVLFFVMGLKLLGDGISILTP